MLLVESRNINNKIDFKNALINPNAPQGGLYCPLNLPQFHADANLSYKDFALKLIQSFDFGYEAVFEKALRSYEKFDDKNSPIVLTKLGHKSYMNELWHGPTRAFKDIALQAFGVLLNHFCQDEKILVLCATSGDTGPATLKSFENLENIRVFCIYPKGATSNLQELQMRSLDKNNLRVLAIEGNFDHAQAMVKNLLTKQAFKDALRKIGYTLSVANSINFGRILFQIIYHYYASLKLWYEFGEDLEIIIPSGNFGNALGAYYAKLMGAKISKIKIACNANSILSDFFNKGEYDLRNRTLKKTVAPAMDILISSNIERLLFHKFKDSRTKQLMTSLKNEQYFKLKREELQSLQEDFEADFCTDEECMIWIKKSKILIDPHTATCFKMLDLSKPSIITSTAEWTKFTPSIIRALFNRECRDESADLKLLARNFGIEVKEELLALFDLTLANNKTYKIGDLENEILRWVQE